MKCKTCGKIYSHLDMMRGYHFSSPSLRKGEYASPSIIHGLSEEILTCPADPMEALDEAMREGDSRVGPTDSGEESPSTPGGSPTATHRPE